MNVLVGPSRSSARRTCRTRSITSPARTCTRRSPRLEAAVVSARPPSRASLSAVAVDRTHGRLGRRLRAVPRRLDPAVGVASSGPPTIPGRRRVVAVTRRMQAAPASSAAPRRRELKARRRRGPGRFASIPAMAFAGSRCWRCDATIALDPGDRAKSALQRARQARCSRRRRITRAIRRGTVFGRCCARACPRARRRVARDQRCRRAGLARVPACVARAPPWSRRVRAAAAMRIVSGVKRSGR